MQRNRPTGAIILLQILLLIWVSACAVNPVTGQRQLMLVSEPQEIELGKDTDQEIAETYGFYDDPDLTAYVAGVGLHMARLSHRPNLPYEFKILDSPVINAFAAPGGYIYFTRGILAHFNSEAELAGVMGHEIGHITARHSAEQLSKAQLAQVGLGVGMILSETFKDFADLAQFGVGMLFLKFSRDNERQSDDLGVEYASRAGYDAGQMAFFFETLERMSPSSGPGGLPEWFSTHPNPENRSKVVQQRANEWQQKLGLTAPKVLRNEYLNRIDGLVFGEDPRKGYTTGQVFYHPTLGIQFPVPAGWKLQNTANQVQMQHPDKTALLLFGRETGASAQKSAQTFISQSKAAVRQDRPVTIGGFKAHELVSDIQTQKGPVQAHSVFIEKNGSVFGFHGVTSPDRFPAVRSTFQASVSGFRSLTDRDKLHVQPDRIRIRTVEKGGVAADLLRTLGVSEDELQDLALLNGLQLKDSLPAGFRLKIVEKGRISQ